MELILSRKIIGKTIINSDILTVCHRGRVLGIDKRNDQKRQQPQAKPADILISAAKHGGGERNYFINGILLRTNA